MALSSSNVLSLFFKYLQTNGISYCIVGNTDDFPDLIESDVDIIIPQEKIKTIHSVMFAFCKEKDFNLVQCLQHENNAFYYVIQWGENNLPKFLKLDICGNYYRKAKLFLKADELLSNIEESKDRDGTGKGFFVPVPATEFMYYLLKKIDKGNLNKEQATHLHTQWIKDPTGCLNNVRRFWNNEDSELIKRAAESNDWNQVINVIPRLQRSIHKNVQITSQGIIGEFAPGTTCAFSDRTFCDIFRAGWFRQKQCY